MNKCVSIVWLSAVLLLSACGKSENLPSPRQTPESGIRASPSAFTFVCSDDPSDLLVVRYNDGEPSTMLAQRQGEARELTIAPSGSGARYVSGSTSYWEHQGEVALEWGEPAVSARCVPRD